MSSSGVRQAQGRFLAYLPHDNDNSIAGNPEAEGAVIAINEELEGLLLLDEKEFWEVAGQDSSLQLCLDSYLRFQK